MNIKSFLEQIRQEIAMISTLPDERLQSNSSLAIKYAELLYRYKESKNKIKIKLDKLYYKLYKEAKFNSSYLLKTKQDIESFIYNDSEYLKLKMKYDELDNFVELLTNLVDIYKQREASERLIFKFKTGVE